MPSYCAPKGLRLCPPLALTFILLGLSACASTPELTQPSILAAQQAIEAAESARVLDAASPELTQARSKLVAAQAAQAQKRPVEAKQLADEARLAAELGVARARAARAKVVNDDMKTSNSTLNTELQRNNGGQP